MSERLPALFLGHGSPMTAITDCPERRAFEALGKSLPRPRAILVVTAHWETSGRTHLTAGERPRTIHDFRGFPQELFDVDYPAPGSAALVDRVGELLGEDRILRDESWGFDHGAWGVVMPMYPGADIPMVAMSLDRALPDEQHLAIGAALAPLRDEGVLIVSSGNIVHNISVLFREPGRSFPWAHAFRDRINAALLEGRDRDLMNFATNDEDAALAVNTAEHYLPLLYAVGARLPGDETVLFNDTVDRSLSMTSVLIGNPDFGPA